MTGGGARERTRRRVPGGWCLPPATLRAPGERLEGEYILAESPGAIGLLLWRTVRDVVLWAGTPAGGRGELFASQSADGRLAILTGTAILPELSSFLTAIHAMLSLNDLADVELLSVCCLRIAAWAHHRAGLPHTAIAFAQAAAQASPAFAEPAVAAGTYALAAGDSVRAETWLRVAVHLGRRERDRVAYTAALVELGALYEGRGEVGRAEDFYRLAFRAARRCGARSARMRAAHGLFRLALRRDDADSAAQFASSAQSAFEADAPGGQALLLDLARYWTDLGYTARARTALRRLRPSLRSLPRASLLAALALTARVRARPRHKGGAPSGRAAWVLLADRGIADGIRCSAAVDLAHAARIEGDLAAFREAKRVVLRLTPQTDYPAVAMEMAEMWPQGGPATRERAS